MGQSPAGELAVPGHAPVVGRIQDGLTNLIRRRPPLLIAKLEPRARSPHQQAPALQDPTVNVTDMKLGLVAPRMLRISTVRTVRYAAPGAHATCCPAPARPYVLLATALLAGGRAIT